MVDSERVHQRAVYRLGKLGRRLPPLALDPGLWPDDGPIFAAYLQARPFEVHCDALTSMPPATARRR